MQHIEQTAINEITTRATVWLKDYLSDGYAHDAEKMNRIAASLGFSPNTMHRARINLGIKAIQINNGKYSKFVWQLPTAQVPNERT